MKIAIGIATTGRREQMRLTLQQISLQTRLPDRVIICPASADDLDLADLQGLPFPTEVVEGSRGLTRQRNAILNAADEFDAMLFLDDDFYPAGSYLALLEQGLNEHQDVVVMTNHPIADGASGPGIKHEEALERLRAHASAQTHEGQAIGETYGGYGCNMTFRLNVICKHNLRFDTCLPLYGWLEDIDFSRQMAAHGRVCHNRRLIGVHLGTKSGRTSGIRLGYSQIANPIYLYRKGTMNPGYAWQHIWRNFLRNLVLSLSPEPWVDRRGRLRGNWMALRDLLRARLRPERVITL